MDSGGQGENADRVREERMEDAKKRLMETINRNFERGEEIRIPLVHEESPSAGKEEGDDSSC